MHDTSPGGPGVHHRIGHTISTFSRSARRSLLAPDRRTILELPSHRREQMQQAEITAAQDILEEGGRYFPGAELIRKEGRPEREIVNTATEWAADLVVICPRSPQSAGPPLGPKSVGHVARFVLDHAPCPVLLVRPIAREVFPIPR